MSQCRVQYYDSEFARSQEQKRDEGGPEQIPVHCDLESSTINCYVELARPLGHEGQRHAVAFCEPYNMGLLLRYWNKERVMLRVETRREGLGQGIIIFSS
jgi:hypothetical protein